MDWWHQFLLLSDAARVAVIGLGFVALAAVALVAEQIRGKRARIDRVGCMPWMTIFLLGAVLGLGLIATALPAIVRG